MAEPALAAGIAVAATVAVYLAAERLYRRAGTLLLNPVLVSVAVLIAALLVLGVDHATYQRGGRLVAFFLGPAVVALAVPLHLQWGEIARRGRAILLAVLAGSAVGIVAGGATAALLGAPPAVVRSVVPRSVTTPIAMAVAEKAGGIPPLTAALVIASGLLGAMVGPALLRRTGVRSRTAAGLAMGAAAHGIGTARALEEGEAEGAAAGLAIGLMGLATALLTPLLVRLLF
ncbi:MAG TPA: LrgB family protein [Longimicrobiaceae bacterium]